MATTITSLLAKLSAEHPGIPIDALEKCLGNEQYVSHMTTCDSLSSMPVDSGIDTVLKWADTEGVTEQVENKVKIIAMAQSLFKMIPPGMQNMVQSMASQLQPTTALPVAGGIQETPNQISTGEPSTTKNAAVAADAAPAITAPADTTVNSNNMKMMSGLFKSGMFDMMQEMMAEDDDAGDDELLSIINKKIDLMEIRVSKLEGTKRKQKRK